MEQYQAGGAMDLGLWFDEVMKLQPETAYLNHRKLLYSFGYELDGSVSPSSGMQTESTTYLFAENRYLFNREQEVSLAKLGAERMAQLRAVDAVFYEHFVKEELWRLQVRTSQRGSA